MKKEMLINVAQPEECRIAIVENGILEELYVERTSQESYVGNIYKGKVVNIEPSIQAVFVDFGIGRNGFLHVSDVDPAYYKHLLPKHVLAEIEAEQDEKYGVSSRPRREDRGDRRGRRREREDEATPRESAPITSWLPETADPSLSVQDENDFGAGLELEEFVGDTAFAETQAGRMSPAENKQDSDSSNDFNPFQADPPPLPVDPPKSQVSQRPAVTIEYEEQEVFGAGLELEPEPEPESASAVEEDAQVALAASESDDKTEKKARKKTDGKKPAKKPRRKRDEPDAPYMETAEHRTSPPDEEGEIRPFFDGNLAESFDVNAPNDRFTSQVEPGQIVDDDAFEFNEINQSSQDSEVMEPKVLEDDFAPPVPRSEPSNRRSSRGDRSRRRDDRSDRQGPRDERRPRDRFGNGGRPPRDKGFPRLPIEQIFKRGQEVIVQVIKEGIGTKGPTLSTYISIAGRYLVLMPSLARVGVSRKIEDMDARRRLREIMKDLDPPAGVGFIVRTAAIDRNPEELQSDLAYLLRLWQVIVRRLRKVSAPVEIYRESDMITRTIRDNFKSDIDSIVVDDPIACQHAAEFMQVVMPRYADRIRQHDGPEPLFHKYRLEDEIAKLSQKRLELPRGGSIIIEQTEALVAIDVNSGTYRSEKDAEETAYQVNLMAAKEIARQLRLRDLGGVIVNDFIDMRDERHRRHVEKTLHEALERDKARTKILRISQFGIIEMTRQRMQQSLKKRIFNECSHCKGTGHVKTNETLGIEAMRLLHLAASRAVAGTAPITAVSLTVCTEAANYLLNKKRRDIAALEDRAKMEIAIHGLAGVSPDHLEVKCHDSNGNEVKLLQSGPPPKLNTRGHRRFND